MTKLLVFTFFASPAFAVNGADDSPVLAPGAPVARPLYVMPTTPAAAQPRHTVSQLPIDTAAPPVPVTPQPESPSPSPSPSHGSGQDNPMAALAPMMQGLGGGGGGGGRGEDRAVGSGSSGSNSAPAASGPSSALETKGSAGEKNGQAMTTVNGCAEGPGKFQLIYGDDKTACSPGRDGALKMSETLSSFMNANLNRCVSVASGSNVSGGKLFHAGVIGDSRHQQTGSLHNLGLAIDVKAIQVAGGRTYSYRDKDPGTSTFFQKFRECWGDAAQKERLGCLQNGRSGTAPGTVGEEDSNHKNHLHLSVPLCPADAKAKGLYMARVFAWLLPLAHADDAKVSRRVVRLPGRGLAELAIRDQHGEPVDADHRFTVRVRCEGERVARTLLSDEGGCDFVSFEKVKDQLELRYLASQMMNGELSCRKLVIRTLAPACPASR